MWLPPVVVCCVGVSCCCFLCVGGSCCCLLSVVASCCCLLSEALLLLFAVCGCLVLLFAVLTPPLSVSHLLTPSKQPGTQCIQLSFLQVVQYLRKHTSLCLITLCNTYNTISKHISLYLMLLLCRHLLKQTRRRFWRRLVNTLTCWTARFMEWYPSVTHALTQSPMDSRSHSHSHSVTRTPTQPLVHSRSHSHSHSVTRTPTQPLVHSLVHSYTHSATRAHSSATHTLSDLLDSIDTEQDSSTQSHRLTEQH